MKTKFKSVFTGLFYILITADFIALAVWNFVLTADMEGYLAVLTFVLGSIALTIGVALAYIDGLALLDKVFSKNKTVEDEDDGEEQ